jgi:hypothetical protein
MGGKVLSAECSLVTEKLKRFVWMALVVSLCNNARPSFWFDHEINEAQLQNNISQ